MKLNSGITYLTENGYSRFETLIQTYETELRGILRQYGDMDIDYSDQNNPETYSSNNDKQQFLTEKIKTLRTELYYARMIQKHGNESLADIDDVLNICINGNNGITMNTMIMLSDYTEPPHQQLVTPGPKVVSINSPLGRAIYRSKVGDTCPYTVFNDSEEISYIASIIDLKKARLQEEKKRKHIK